MSRAWVVVRWAPFLVVGVLVPLLWILLPWFWSDFKQELADSKARGSR